MTNPSVRSGVQGWFVYRRLDRIILYSRIYSAMESEISTEKATAFTKISTTLLSQIRNHYQWIEAEQLYHIELDTH